jgi:M6 family metalloprotease-like protein
MISNNSLEQAPRWNLHYWLLMAILVLTSGMTQAGVYPREGKEIQWVQPNGKELALRVIGDDFYARTITKEGFTVVYSEAEQAYYFAALDKTGKSFVSSGIPADQSPPAGLKRHLKESSEIAKSIRDANVQATVPDRAANWAARVKAVRALRASKEANPFSNSTMSASDIQALGAPVSGAKAGLVTLVQFPDDPATVAIDTVSFPASQAKISRMCNEVGYTDDGMSGSVRDYFYDQSDGQLTHTQVVSTVITLPQPRNYYNYADYPSNTTLRSAGTTGVLLVNDAITKLKADGFNFSTLSVDANRDIIATSLLFAGSDSGVWAKGLWPHAYAVSRINVGTTASPRYIRRYQCTNVPTAAPTIGTICHELGHLLLSYPDFYDTDSSDGASEGVGEHCLMGSGSFLNGSRTPAPIDLYLKDCSGWANITDLEPIDVLAAALPTTGNVGYRIRKPGSTTEYFLVENRGTGDKWATYCKDKGIAIWHVDEEVTTDNQRQQRTPSEHYELSLEQADGAFDLENDRDRGDSTDLFDNIISEFNNTTVPNAAWWDGSASNISVSVRSAAGASMNVNFGGGGGGQALTLSPASQNVPAIGGTYSFNITTASAWSWSDDATWVTSSEAVNQTGSQTFTYTVAANPGSARTASVTIVQGGTTRIHSVLQEGAASDDHGNSIASATVVSQNSSTNGNLESPGDYDFFRINVTGTGNLLVETTGSTDTLGAVLNSAGTELANDDDTGDGSNFRIYAPVTTGAYYVKVRHYDEDGTGTYVLVVSLSAGTTLSLTPTTQNIVGQGETASFTVSSNTSWSWTVNAAWVTSSESTVQSGNQLFSYAVAPNSSASARTAVITLTGAGVTRTHTINQAVSAPDDHGNNIATATLFSVNSSINGAIGIADDEDYFRINITDIGNLTLQTTGTTDSLGGFFDSSGTLLATDDDDGDASNFLITFPVNPGAYYVRVRHYNPTATGAYVLTSNFASVPTLSVSPSVRSVTSAVGSSTFTVTANVTWSWSSNAAWLTSTAANSQSGSQTFTFNVAANTSGAQRTGTITLTSGILSATFSLTQFSTALPDLVNPPTAPSASPVLLPPGGTLGFQADARNQGTAASGAFVVKFYLSTDSVITTTDVFLGEKSMPSIAAAATTGIDEANFTIPETLALGTYYAGWIYDPDNTVAESNNANNVAVLASQPITVTDNLVKLLTQSLPDGSTSIWGDFTEVDPSWLQDASLTTVANGESTDAFDDVGKITVTPALSLPPMNASTDAGPLVSIASANNLSLVHRISLVPGRHATDELILLTNTAATAQAVTLQVDDDYGSDTDTVVHATSSGDAVLTTADHWFVSSDQITPNVISDDPALQVSWRFTGNLPTPTFLTVPSSTGLFSMKFNSFQLAAGQAVSVTIRRELFDSGSLATLNGLPVKLTPPTPVALNVSLSGNSVNLNFGGMETGVNHTIQRSYNLQTWTPLGQRTTANPTFSETKPASQTKVYYRLVR